eukprot:CAMPEP_0179118988 /NCGR_PEP_ID=MMETSP0796-20121207/55993_1 /TAXON_ID=73915 /ORGANISM="Pyrodinium bahamense, Strain pbaha01" /LENGTH=490 /DNA_ID=CAMNT_0020817475 /DNA_START=11 /DNA_END=1483 /DNA_ORIENTATION=+
MAGEHGGGLEPQTPGAARTQQRWAVPARSKAPVYFSPAVAPADVPYSRFSTGGSSGLLSFQLPSLSLRREEVEKKFAADVYDESFLGGFVNGYDASVHGRTMASFAGCTRKSLVQRSPRWLEYFEGLQSSPPRTPSASPKKPTAGRSPLQRANTGWSSQPADGVRTPRMWATISKVGAPGEEPPTPAHPSRPSSSLGAGEKATPRQRHAAPSKPLTPKQRPSAMEKAVEASVHSQQSQRQREACESLRMLVFGHIGNEDWLIQDRPRIFEQQRGTEAEIETFVDQWLLLDDDDSGTIDVAEFLDFFTKKKADKLLTRRCVRYLVGRTGEQQVGRADLVRLLWLRATDEDVADMEALFNFKKLQRASVEPPPFLPKRRRRELLENFRDLDHEGTGLVPYSELVLAGLADEGMMQELRAKYDKDGNGTLDFEEFLEMLCPYGFRAHEKVNVAINKDGLAIREASCMCGEHRFSGWFLEPDYLALKNKYNFDE